jgi:hypothetical protein
MEGDVEGLLRDAIHLGFLPQDVDKSKLLPVLQHIFDEAKIQADMEMKSRASSLSSQGDNKGKYTALAGRRKKFGAISQDLNQVKYS